VIRSLLLALGTLAVLLASCGHDTAPPSATPTSILAATTTAPLKSTLTLADATPEQPLIVHLGAGTFIVEIADNATEHTVGLSGRDALPLGSGMWFSYDGAGERSFWMRDMHFPIDIVWIDSSMKVVGITEDAPAPSPETSTSELPYYSPEGPVMYVLEINAGLTHDLGIEVGTLAVLGHK
jgi:uncharacterized membrane protein (UPF0127 family)